MISAPLPSAVSGQLQNYGSIKNADDKRGMEALACLFVNFRWNLTCDFMLNSFDMPRSFLSDVSNQSLSKKMGSKKRQNLHKKYSQRRGRSQAEISSWQSNKSVKITHLLSWHTKEGLFYFLTLLLWLSDVIYQNIISYFPGDGENSQDNGTPSHLLRSL